MKIITKKGVTTSICIILLISLLSLLLFTAGCDKDARKVNIHAFFTDPVTDEKVTFDDFDVVDPFGAERLGVRVEEDVIDTLYDDPICGDPPFSVTDTKNNAFSQDEAWIQFNLRDPGFINWVKCLLENHCDLLETWGTSGNMGADGSSFSCNKLGTYQFRWIPRADISAPLQHCGARVDKVTWSYDETNHFETATTTPDAETCVYTEEGECWYGCDGEYYSEVGRSTSNPILNYQTYFRNFNSPLPPPSSTGDSWEYQSYEDEAPLEYMRMAPSELAEYGSDTAMMNEINTRTETYCSGFHLLVTGLTDGTPGSGGLDKFLDYDEEIEYGESQPAFVVPLVETSEGVFSNSLFTSVLKAKVYTDPNDGYRLTKIQYEIEDESSPASATEGDDYTGHDGLTWVLYGSCGFEPVEGEATEALEITRTTDAECNQAKAITYTGYNELRSAWDSIGGCCGDEADDCTTTFGSSGSACNIAQGLFRNEGIEVPDVDQLGLFYANAVPGRAVDITCKGDKITSAGYGIPTEILARGGMWEESRGDCSQIYDPSQTNNLYGAIGFDQGWGICFGDMKADQSPESIEDPVIEYGGQPFVAGQYVNCYPYFGADCSKECTPYAIGTGNDGDECYSDYDCNELLICDVVERRCVAYDPETPAGESVEGDDCYSFYDCVEGTRCGFREPDYCPAHRNEYFYPTQYYCTETGKWVSDLDSGDYAETCGRASNYDELVEAHTWTGSKCCGEPQDMYAATLSEKYNDYEADYTRGEGNCLLSFPIFEGGFFYESYLNYYIRKRVSDAEAMEAEEPGITEQVLEEIPYTEEEFNSTFGIFDGTLMTWRGTFQGCAIPDSDLDWRSWQDDYTGDALIAENDYCVALEKPLGDYWYCDPITDRWQSGMKLDHLSEVPGGGPAQLAEEVSAEDTGEEVVADETGYLGPLGCCLENQCWDGYECIDDQSLEDTKETYLAADEKEYKCIEGSWESAERRYTWDGLDYGYCEEGQCYVGGTLLDPNGVAVSTAFGYEQCVPDKTYIGDHYCNYGDWYSRTQIVANTMMDLAGSDYVLSCAPIHKVVNDVSYTIQAMTGETFVPVEFFENSIYCSQYDPSYQGDRCANNVCVLKDGEELYIGTSLNLPIDDEYNSFLNALGMDREDCSDALDGGMEKCAGNVHYDNDTGIIIFSKDNFDVADTALEGSVDGVLEIFFGNLAGLPSGSFSKPTGSAETFEFLGSDFGVSRLFHSRIGGKEVIGTWSTAPYTFGADIEGVEEMTYLKEYMAISMNGFSTDFCVKVNQMRPGSCVQYGGTYYIAFKRDYGTSEMYEGSEDLIDAGLYYDMTQKLRYE